MGIMDIILMILIAAALTGAVVSIIRQHRCGRGCGYCNGCHGCDRQGSCPTYGDNH